MIQVGGESNSWDTVWLYISSIFLLKYADVALTLAGENPWPLVLNESLVFATSNSME